MDKRSIAAIALLFLMWAFYPTYLKWITPKQPANQIQLDKEIEATKDIAELSAAHDSEGQISQAVIPAPAVEETIKPVEMEIETGSLRATFSNIGGGLRRLTSFMKRNGHVEEIVLFDIAPGQPSVFAMVIPGLAFDLERTPHQGPSLSPNGRGVEFSYTLPSGVQLTKKFKVDENNFALRLEVEAKNPTAQTQPFFFELGSTLQETEPSIKDKPTRLQSLASYAKIGSDVKRAGFQKLKKKGEYLEGEILWTALGRLYFAVFVKPEENTHFEGFRASADNTTLRGAARVPTREIVAGGEEHYSFLIYAGPTYRAGLKSFGAEFEAILSSGIWGIFKTIVLAMLGFFFKLLKNYGLAILAVAFATRVAFWPLTHKSFESMQKLQMLQPKMKAIQEQYKNTPEKLQKEMMEFYKRHKVNPFGGCLPMLVQMPMFFALYQVLSEAVELRGAPFFGWINDLSEPDLLYALPFSLPFFKNAIRLLPIIYIFTTVLQQKLQPTVSSGTNREQEQMMKLMPIFIGFIFYHMPSGLVLYFIISNLLMMQSQLALKRKFSSPSPEAPS